MSFIIICVLYKRHAQQIYDENSMGLLLVRIRSGIIPGVSFFIRAVFSFNYPVPI